MAREAILCAGMPICLRELENKDASVNRLQLDDLFIQGIGDVEVSVRRCLLHVSMEVGLARMDTRGVGNFCSERRPESFSNLVTEKELSVSEYWRFSQCNLACTYLARWVLDTYF